MQYEKSCGAVVYLIHNDKRQYLLLKHRNGGHWGFPKGHVEAGESEQQTALREILEETGLEAQLAADFRYAMEYTPKPGVIKEVIYFIGNVEQPTAVCQETEIEEYRWACYEDATNLLTHGNSRDLLAAAERFLS